MFNKTWEEMRAIDVMPYCDYREAKDSNNKKIQVPYLNWAKCKELLHANGAETVYYEPITNANGSSLLMSEVAAQDKNGNTNRCYEVAVHVVIDELEFDMQTPLLNGTYVVHNETLNQLRVANAQARAFVKGVAIHTGLGFELWSNFESKEEVNAELTKNVDLDDLKDIKEYVQEVYTQKIKQGYTTSEIAEKLGLTTDIVKAYFSYFDMLKKFADDLQKL